MVDYKEEHGNARASALAYQQAMQRMAEQFVRAEGLWERLDEGALSVDGFSVRLPKVAGGDYMVVVRAYKEGVAVVCFHGADTLADSIRGMLARLENGSVKWKEDQYRDGAGKQ